MVEDIEGVVDDTDVLLVAENHSVPDHAEIEMDIVSLVEPDYVFMEGKPSDRDIDELMGRFERNKTIYNTGKQFAEKYGESFLKEDPETILSESLQEIESEMEKSRDFYSIEDGIIPDDAEEFISVPVYELHPLILEETYEAVREEGENNEAQEDLAELKDAYGNIYKCVDERSALVPRKLRNLKPLVEEGEIEILSENNKFMDQGYHHPILDATPDRKTEELIEENRKTDEGRERCMGQKLAKYAGESESPILGLIGKYHAREGSELYPELESEDLNYSIVKLKDDEPFEKSAEQYISEAELEYVTKEYVNSEALTRQEI